ncbi:cell division protein [Oesophagostomum dentatum]|uniref:Septin n=3 Tax=Oesophagostomum dentatum TaxID=61180 RepID=A0A0B1T3Z8_OESDE|nr:cell division protein [Oesophagostomum dentatum]
MSRAKLDESRTSLNEAQNYWGFANFPNQVFRRAIKDGFNFTLMVVGRSGLGKSTFINTLFMAEINDLKEAPAPTGSTVRIEEKHVKLVENTVKLNLTLVDTPGFGDAVNNTRCWEPIINYVDGKFLEFFCEETKIERKERPVDKCVHLCLYFIEPSGHGLKPLDIEFMKQLHTRVNIVPVIAKADCLTKDELKKFKAQAASEKLKSCLPFAVVGSNMLKEEGGKRIRYREYPWGVVEVENMAHNDFIPLRDMVVRTNLIDMIDVTRSVHYENFRLRQMDKLPKHALDKDPFTQMEEDRKKKENELAEKKKSFEKTFADRVNDREIKINERTARLDVRERDLKQEIELRKVELERLKQEIEDLRRGSIGDSKTSLSMTNENSGKSSPTDKIKKKTGTLGLFNRN